MKSSNPSSPTIPEQSKAAEAVHTQAEINNRVLSLYFECYEFLPKDMGIDSRKASRYFAKCVEQANQEMGPAIEFSGGEFTPAVVTLEVQSLIDRLALLKASPKERAKLMHFRW